MCPAAIWHEDPCGTGEEGILPLRIGENPRRPSPIGGPKGALASLMFAAGNDGCDHYAIADSCLPIIQVTFGDVDQKNMDCNKKSMPKQPFHVNKS